jgi:hypothetical protein
MLNTTDLILFVIYGVVPALFTLFCMAIVLHFSESKMKPLLFDLPQDLPQGQAMQLSFLLRRQERRLYQLEQRVSFFEKESSAPL